jgi:hypothetical protein
VAALLVLLMGTIYDVQLEMASCGVIYLLSLVKIGSGSEGILRSLPQQSERL